MRIRQDAAVAIFLILVLILCSISWTLEPQGDFTRLAKIAAVLIPAALMFDYCRRVTFVPAFGRAWLMPVMLAVIALVLFAEQRLNFPLYRLVNDLSADEKVRKSILNRNLVALVVLSFSSCLFVERKKFALVLAALLPVLLVTKSQSAQLAFITGSFFLVLFPAGKKWAWRGLQAAIAAGFFGAPWLAQWGFKNMLVVAQENSWLDEAAAAPRLEIWNFVSRKIMDHPFIGHGIEATRKMTFETDQLFYHSDTVLHPHNIALQGWIEFGVIGAILFAAIIIYGIERMRIGLSTAEQKAGLAVFGAWFVVALSGYGMWQSWWLGLGAIVAIMTLCGISFSRQRAAGR